jgi:DoxX-like family
MTTATHIAPPAAARPVARRTSYVLSTLVVGFLLLDAVAHVLQLGPVPQAMTTLGFDPGDAVTIGVLELVCVVLYVVPRTAVLGAVLLTGYLGGALCAQLRIDAPVLSTLLFPVYVGVAVWGALWLRDARARLLLAG